MTKETSTNLEYQSPSKRTLDQSYEDEFWVDIPQKPSNKKQKTKLFPSINNKENNNTNDICDSENIHPHLTKPCSAPTGENNLLTNNSNILTPNRSWSKLFTPKPLRFERGKILDRRPREGWGFQNTTLEDVQDQLLNVKKTTQKTSRENTKLRSKCRRLERDLRKKDKTVQSLLAMAVDEREPQSCDLLVMLQQQQSETVALKKENQNLKKEISIAEENLKTLRSTNRNSHINELNKNLEIYYEELLRLRKIITKMNKITEESHTKIKQNKTHIKRLSKDAMANKKMLNQEKKHVKKLNKVSTERLETIRSLKSKLATAETRLEENLRTVTLLKNKMSRFERQFRKQMNGDGARKIYYDIEKDMEKLRREIMVIQKQKQTFMNVLNLASNKASDENVIEIFQNVGHWWNICAEYVDQEEMAYQATNYLNSFVEKKAEKEEEEQIQEIQLDEDDAEAEEEAATKIQARWRGHEARKEQEHKKEAATSIQKKWKKHDYERKDKAAKKIQKEWKKHEHDKNEAATKIQKQWKKHEEDKNEAATAIQKKWKKHDHERKDKAAKKIQNEWRKHEKDRHEKNEEEVAVVEKEEQLKVESDNYSEEYESEINVNEVKETPESATSKEKVPEPTTVSKEVSETKISNNEQNEAEIILVQSILRSKKFSEPPTKEESSKIEEEKEISKPTEIIVENTNEEDIVLLQSLVRAQTSKTEESSQNENFEENSKKIEKEVILTQSVIRARTPQVEENSKKVENEENLVLVQSIVRAQIPNNNKKTVSTTQNENKNQEVKITTESELSASKTEENISSNTNDNKEESIILTQSVIRAKIPKKQN